MLPLFAMLIQSEQVTEEVFHISGRIILLFCCVVFADAINVHIIVHSILIYYYII